MQVVFWTTVRGDSPITEFIDSVPVKSKKKIVRTLELIEKHGLGFVKCCTKLKDGIYELKIRFDKVFYRLLIFFERGVCFVLHIFKKKSNKIQSRELETALARSKNLPAVSYL